MGQNCYALRTFHDARFSRDDVQTFLRGVVAVTADLAGFHLTGKIDNPPRFWFPNLGEDYPWEGWLL
jgi:hypothetical protein